MPHDTARKGLSPLIVRTMMVLLFIIWSNAFTAIKHLREIFTPMELILARFLPFALFGAAYLISARKRRKETGEILKGSLLKIAGMGAFGIAGYNYFIYLAQSEIKPGAAALITTLAPLMTLILAIIFLRERVPARRVAGIFIAFAGLFIVIRYGRVGMGKVTWVPSADIRYALLATLAPLSWSVYTVIGKDLVSRRSPFTVTCLSTIIGTVPFLPVLGTGFIMKVQSMEVTHWLALGHLTILSTIVGFWVWNFALKYLPTTSVSSFIYLNPPFAALFGWLFFSEEVTPMFIAGSAVVLLGLYLSQSRRRGLE